MPLKRQTVLRELNRIWDEHTERLRTPDADQAFSPTKNENARNYLKREIYKLGKRILRDPPKSWSTADIVKERRGANRRTDKLGAVFHDLLMAVYDEDWPKLDRQERWSVAQELEYAHRHKVPSKYLCGFLYQSGPRTDLRAKLKADYVEPAFRCDA